MSKVIFKGNPDPFDIVERSGFPIKAALQVQDGENITGDVIAYRVLINPTKEAVAYFKQWHAFNQGATAATEPRECTVQYNRFHIFTGTATLNSFLDYGNATSEIRLEIVGGNAIWFEPLGQLKLVDLNLFPDHELTQAAVLIGGIANPDSGDIWGYTVVKYKEWENLTSIAPYEHTLFVTYWGILTKAFNKLGFNLVSEFFPRRFIMPIFKAKYSEEFIRRYWFAGYDTNNPLIPTPFAVNDVFMTLNAGKYNPYGYFNVTTGRYTVQYSGNYQITLFRDNLHDKYSIKLNGVSQAFPWGGTVSGDYQTRTYFLNAGTTIQPIYTTDLGTALPIGFFYFLVATELEQIENSAVIHDAILPDVSVKDILTALSQAFGLVLETDLNTRTVTIEPRDDCKIRNVTKRGFYRNTNPLISPEDVVKPRETLNEIDGTSSYSYRWLTDSADAEQVAAEKKSVLKVGEAAYLLRDPAVYKKANKTIENSLICKTMQYWALDIRYGTGLVPVIPYASKQYAGFPSGDDDYRFGVRILYFAGRRSGQDGFIGYMQTGGTTAIAYDYPASYFVNYNDVTGQDISLSYSDQYTRNGIELPGLLKRLFLNHLKRLESSKTVVEYINLAIKDIAPFFSFRRKYKDKRGRFIIKALENTTPTEDSVKITLQEDADAQDIDLTKLTHSNNFDNIINKTI